MIRDFISARLAANILLFSLGLLLLFHILILLGILPGDIIWGGRAEAPSDKLVLELIALAITILMGIVVAARFGYIPAGSLQKPVRIAMWLVFGYFLLNTIGNWASEVRMETVVFTPVTLILAFFAYRLAIEK
ncbi:MAG: hypothetical protein EP344_02770 [Bacteroidetes bacterium]|nr:MAG: hypothetical protein EP344_02770 [Bacteroidota bacterium]